MDVFRAFFGCRGDGGFNGCCAEASSGDGGFMLACISSRRGVIGFKAVMSLCPVREIVRPARSDGGSEREKVRPAHEKWPKIDGLWRAGRIFSRKHRWRGCVGRTFSRKCRCRCRVGRTFSRSPGAAGASHRPDMPSTPDGPGRPDVPVGISPGAPRAPGAWRARRRPASRRSGSPALPIRRPSRSSGTSERSRGR